MINNGIVSNRPLLLHLPSDQYLSRSHADSLGEGGRRSSGLCDSYQQPPPLLVLM